MPGNWRLHPVHAAKPAADQRVALEHLRRVILSAAPGAVESISYGIPTFKVKGRAVAHLGADPPACGLQVMPPRRWLPVPRP